MGVSIFFFTVSSLSFEKKKNFLPFLTVAADDQPLVPRAQPRDRDVGLGRDAEARLVRGADPGLEALELPVEEFFCC